MNLRREFERAQASWTPPASSRPRGIVMCAGGHRLLANAYIALRRLRELTDLPVELFHAGPAEMPVAALLQADFSPLTVHDLGPHLRGYHIKPFALLACSFEEVLLLDADNLLLAAPPFGHPALFWPDLPEARWTQDSLYTDLGLDPVLNGQSPEFESGQMVLDRRHCWRALRAAAWLSSETVRPHVYSRANGDKDIFRLACHLTGTDYTLVAPPPRRFGGSFLILPIPFTGLVLKLDHPLGRFYATGLLQHHPLGHPLCAHRTVMEWKPYLDSVAMTHLEGRPDPTLAELERWGQRELQTFRRRYGPLFSPDRGEQLQALLRRLIVSGTRRWSAASPPPA